MFNALHKDVFGLKEGLGHVGEDRSLKSPLEILNILPHVAQEIPVIRDIPTGIEHEGPDPYGFKMFNRGFHGFSLLMRFSFLHCLEVGVSSGSQCTLTILSP